ncbi:MAG: amidohydrolase family protein [Methylococcaceae bacterium]|nr:amidohydrolase family protein [Methylococcaceae bacterium]
MDYAHLPHAEHGKQPQAMPLLSETIVKAIVNEAHQHGRKVTAHLAESKGVKLAINAGIDEWAHIPCNPIPEALLKKAVKQKVKIVTTFDTLSKCSGVAHNAHTWTALGGEFLYGAEIAHPDIPWGIDAQELNLMMHLANLSPLEVLHTATAKAGQYLNIPLLGTLQRGAPADLIAVRGDLMQNFKVLEYPDLVISGGKIVVNYFEKPH